MIFCLGKGEENGLINRNENRFASSVEAILFGKVVSNSTHPPSFYSGISGDGVSIILKGRHQPAIAKHFSHELSRTVVFFDLFIRES